MDSLLDYHSVDIQWATMTFCGWGRLRLPHPGGHGAGQFHPLQQPGGHRDGDTASSLRPLSVFANEEYRDCDVHRFAVKLTGPDADQYSEKDKLLSARMHKAITIILFKLEGQKLLRHPEYDMADRLLLDKIDYEHKCITIGDTTYPLEDCRLPPWTPPTPTPSPRRRARSSTSSPPASAAVRSSSAHPLPLLQGQPV